MDVRIREATPDDAAALAPLLVEVHDLHAEALPAVFRPIAADERTAALLRAQVADETGRAFVAEHGDDLAGYAWVRLHEPPPSHLFVPRRVAEVDTLVVAAARRRRGIGRALVAAAHGWAARHGADEVRVVVWEFNRAAIRFYERLGYATARRTMGQIIGPEHR